MAKKAPQKIEKISVVDQVCNALKESIISGEYKVGDRLPSEAEIAELYGVNRLSVRMALQKLITLGIIETRVGEGSFVKGFSFATVLGEMADFIAYGNRMKDIGELRYVLERACALSAAECYDTAEAETLTNYCEEYCRAFDEFDRNPTDEMCEKFLDADFAIHAQIVHMSGNALFDELYAAVQGLIRMHILKLVTERRKNAELSTVNYKEMHVKLCEAVISHDRDLTKKTLVRLLDAEKFDDNITD